MGWLRHVVVDLLVTIVIILLALQGWLWAEWVIWIYTPLILAVKLFAIAAGTLAALGPEARDVPQVFFHVLYGINVVVLALDGRWILSVGWLIIWGLSAYLEFKD